MAFGKISKQDLIDAGLDPDKLAEFQAKGITKDQLDTFKTEIGNQITISLDTFKNEIKELVIGNRPAPTNNNNNTETRDENEPTEAEQFAVDPTGFVNKKLGSIAGGTAIELKKMARDTAFREASRVLKGFGNATIKAEIEEEWKKYTPEIMARMGTDPADLIVKIHDMLVGRHHDEIVNDTNKKDGKYNLIQSGTTGGGGGGGSNNSNGDNSNKKAEDILSPAELAQARKFGMSADEWLKEKVAADEEEKTRYTVGT